MFYIPIVDGQELPVISEMTQEVGIEHALYNVYNWARRRGYRPESYFIVVIMENRIPFYTGTWSRTLLATRSIEYRVARETVRRMLGGLGVELRE